MKRLLTIKKKPSIEHYRKLFNVNLPVILKEIYSNMDHGEPPKLRDLKSFLTPLPESARPKIDENGNIKIPYFKRSI